MKLVIAALFLLFAVPSFASTDISANASRFTKEIILTEVALSYKNPERACQVSGGVALAVELARIGKDATNSSFPSGHAAGAFAAASALADDHPKHKWLYYAVASVLGYAAVRDGGHSLNEVVAGAALGMAVGHNCEKVKLSYTFKF